MDVAGEDSLHALWRKGAALGGKGRDQSLIAGIEGGSGRGLAGGISQEGVVIDQEAAARLAAQRLYLVAHLNKGGVVRVAWLQRA